MIAAVVYSESGGTYKTTMTANIGVALERMGLDTLLIDLDPQEGNLTSLFDAGSDRSDPEADNLVRHILEEPGNDNDFMDLIEETNEGVDILPSHDMLSDFTSNLEQKINYETGMKDMDRSEYPRYQLLNKVLWEKNKLQNEYDAILIDPNARAEDLLYNGIYAMRTLIAPVKPSGKGNLSLDGLGTLVNNMSDHLNIEIGLSCVVPSGVGQTNAHQHYQERFEETESFDTPVVIPQRESMMDAMWDAKGSAFKVIEERWKSYGKDSEKSSEAGQRRVRDRDVDTLVDLYKLAAFVATNTFDADIDPVLKLDIEGRDSREINIHGEDEKEVKAA